MAYSQQVIEDWKDKKSISEQLQDELEPIDNTVDESGPVNPTEYDESDDIEAIKRVTGE